MEHKQLEQTLAKERIMDQMAQEVEVVSTVENQQTHIEELEEVPDM